MIIRPPHGTGKVEERTMRSSLNIAGTAFLLAICLFSAPLCAAPLQLLSAAEAALPESKNFGFASTLRNEGPAIAAQDLEVDAKDQTFTLLVAFTPKDGAAVDISTLKLECLKSSNIDLTPRIRDFANDEGIKADSISLPPGQYRFRVAISDFKGRFSEKEFMVKVLVNY